MFSRMTSFERLSYVQSDENSCVNELSELINPCKSLTEVFNTISEEEIETDSLKVYLRLRPVSLEENITSQDGNIEILDQQNILIAAPTCSHAFKNKLQGITKVTHRFKFSCVYDQETSQKVLFEETTQDLVKDLVNGQNCLLFSYGATNSGKTYTIQGTPSKSGLLPQTLESLFRALGDQQYKRNNLKPFRFCGVVHMNEKECLKEEEARDILLKRGSEIGGSSFSTSTQSLESRCNTTTTVDDSSSEDQIQNFEDVRVDDTTLESTLSLNSSPDAYYAVYVSFTEIYNEYIYDLLEKSSLSKGGKKSPLVLGEDRDGAIYVRGLREVRVKSAEEALKILEVGRQNLRFAATRLNHHSSRSHSIFTLKLIRLADPLHPNFARVSMLSLCDLAGAERAGKTMSSMDRLKEASNINTSLLVLGRCLAALRHNQIVGKQLCGNRKPVPVPYRDSKVTRLFQPFFMGKGKVAMIVNVSMATTLFDETLKVLKFSALARKVLNTREKRSVVDQIMEEIPKGGSRFSRFMRHSLNMSAASSSRLSAPWHGKSFAEVTFGAGDTNDASKLVAVLEEDEAEEDGRCEALLDLNTKLKERLLKECKSKAELENKLRNEICDAFSKRIVQIEDSWRTRLQDERVRAEELMDWRMKNVLETKKLSTTRKRLRHEDSDDEEMVPSIMLVREEIKVKELEEEKAHLEEETQSLRLALKFSSKALKSSQEENSKLVFDLATSSQLLDEVQKEKEDIEAMMKRPPTIAAENGTVDHRIVEELQLRLQVMEMSLQAKNKEIKKMAGMLEEAAEEFIAKEITITALKTSLASAEESCTQHLDLIVELESQLSEAKHLLDNHGRYLEEREQEIYEMQSQQRHQNMKENSNSTNEDGVAALAETKQDFPERSTQQLLIEMEEIKGQLEAERERSTHLEKSMAQLLADHNQKHEEVDDKREVLQQQLRLLEEQQLSSESEFRKLENSKKTDVEIYQGRIETLESDLKSSVANCETLVLKIEDLQDQLSNENLEEMKKSKASNEFVKQELQRVTMDKEDLEKEMKKNEKDFRDELAKMKDENEKLSARIAAVKKEEQDAKMILLAQIEQLKVNIKEKKLKVTSLSHDLKGMEEVISERSKEVDNLKENLVKKKQNEETLLKDLNQLQKELNETEKEKEERQQVEKKYSHLEHMFKAKTEELESLVTKISRLEEEKTALEDRLQHMKNLAQNQKQDAETISGELLVAGDKLEQLKKANAVLEGYIRDVYQHLVRLLGRYLVNGEENCENIDASSQPVAQLIETNNKSLEQLAAHFQEVEDTYSKMKSDLRRAEQENKACIENSDCLLKEYEDLKRQFSETPQKIDELSSLNSKMNSKNQELKSLLQTKETTIFNLSSKNEVLDQKVSVVEEELERLKTKCQLLEKEAAALREARSEEVGKMRADLKQKEALLSQKEQEISVLQQEIKRALQMTVASESLDKGTAGNSKVKEETMDWQSASTLDSELRMSETEKSLVLHLPSSQEVTATTLQDSNQFGSQEDASKKDTSTACFTPPTQTRRGKGALSRSVSRKRDCLCATESSATNPAVSISSLAKSEFAPETPMKTRSARATRASAKKEVSKSPTARSCKKTVSYRYDLDDSTHEDEEEALYLPKSSTKKSARGRSRRNTTRNVGNPHLEDKENKKTHLLSEQKATLESEKLPSEPVSSRSRRRRRPLYNLEVEEPFDASPDLISVRPITEDSPHSVVRRNLRRILKR